MTSAAPAVSVLMPVRNEADYLQAALDSLYRQTLTDWQLVAIDDGSSDATPALLAEAARNDRRVTVITRQGGGLVPALNCGLEACTAPFIARMDGDDISHPRRFELQHRFLCSNPDIGLVACPFRHFPRSTIKQGMKAYETWQNSLSCHDLIIRDLYVESPFVHPSVMLKRELLQTAGGYMDHGWPEDYDLWLRLAQQGTRFARLPQQLFFWRDHPARATRTMNEYTSAAFRACKLHYLCNDYLKNCVSVVIAGAGLEGRAWQRLLTIRGISVSQWIDVDTRKIGRILHSAPISGVDSLPRLATQKILVAIGVHGARQQFRLLASSFGLIEGTNFICVA